MRRTVLTLCFLSSLSLLSVPRAAAEDKELYALTHIDVAPGSGGIELAESLVRKFVAESRQDPGVVRFEAFQQEGKANHFTIYEVWQSRKAFDAHCEAEHTKLFRAALQPMLGSPYRERLHYAIH